MKLGIYAIAACVIALCIAALVELHEQSDQCRSAGGVLLRGAFGYECISVVGRP